MLMNHPEQFERIAQEWAVKYAGAPKKNLPASHNAGSSYPQSSSKPKIQKSKEQEQRELMAKYVTPLLVSMKQINNYPDIKATTKILSIVS